MTFGAFLEIVLAVGSIFGWYVFLHFLLESFLRDNSLSLLLEVADEETADHFVLVYREAQRSFLCRNGGRVVVLLYRSISTPEIVAYLEEKNIEYYLIED